MPLLTDKEIRSLKPKDRPYKVFDAGGLFILVTPAGSKLWRYKYRFGGKENTLGLGKYPQISLSEARDVADEYWRLRRQGRDPSAHKKALKNPLIELRNTFKTVAEEYLETRKESWSAKHYQTRTNLLTRDLFSDLGERNVGELGAADFLVSLRKIEARTVETARRAAGLCSEIMRYAVQTGRITQNPIQDLKGALKASEKRHLPAAVDEEGLKFVLKAIATYQETPVVTTALKLAPLVFLRSGDLRSAKWEDIDFDKAEWRIVTGKTKTPHITPLSKQALSLLKALRPITEFSPFVFPGVRAPLERPMSDNALVAALRTLGISKETTCIHGFRASARTLLSEKLGFPEHLIEHQISHTVRDPLGRAYNRTTFLEERREMMQRWADFLDQLIGEGPAPTSSNC
jgi:integrase